jgi:hypothetical protein
MKIFPEIEKSILLSPDILPELLLDFKDEIKITDNIKLLNNSERESIFNKIPQAYMDSKLNKLAIRRDHDIRIKEKYDNNKDINDLIKNRQANEIIDFTERHPHWMNIIKDIDTKKFR